MKFSEKWLREWVNPDISTDELVAEITMAGLEVDGTEPVAGPFSNVVVGEIVSLEQHPDADKLRVCQVAGHPDGTQQVVCGAANAREGLKIPFALVGAELPPTVDEEGKERRFKIKKAKLRGVESNGMLCAEQELGMAEQSDGLMELPADAPVGTCIREYLDLDDTIIEVDLTPNRGDCLSMAGLAREVGVLNRAEVSAPEVSAVAPAIDDSFPVTLTEPAACARYAGRVVRNIDISKSAPLWMQEKLRRAGLRSIDPVVDITNYVLLEMGQPMHAFDLNKLQGSIQVRYSTEGEEITLLDEQEVKLKAGTLLIADDKQPLAIAGVMGGADSAVSSDTKDIFFESAYFDPIVIAGKARSYGLHTDSSHRFERGVDFQLQDKAIERATELLLSICGGEPGPTQVVEHAEQLPAREPVVLRASKVSQYLGTELPDAEIESILKYLDMELKSTEAGQWQVQPPTWRFDISIEADLIEEIARIYGYNNLPISSPMASLDLKPHLEQDLPESKLKERLCSLGYTEVVTYSFVDPGLQEKLSPEDSKVAEIPVANPISADMGVMRTSLLPGLLSTALYNLNRQQERVRIFETGLTFVRNGAETEQIPTLGMLLTGTQEPEAWSRKGSQAVDFYDLKGDFESLLGLLGQESGQDWSFAAPEGQAHSALHPGQSAEISFQGENVGFIGALHPALQEELGFSSPVLLAQVVLKPLTSLNVPKFEALSRFPAIRRDIALLVDRDLPAQDLCDEVQNSAGTYLENLKVFDVYSGEGIDPHRKSIGLGLTFRDKSRTLTDSDINESLDQVISALITKFKAELRN